MNNRIEPTDAEYGDLYREWERSGNAAIITALGRLWMVILDNDKRVFVAKGEGNSTDGIDARYFTSSFRHTS